MKRQRRDWTPSLWYIGVALTGAFLGATTLIVIDFVWGHKLNQQLQWIMYPFIFVPALSTYYIVWWKRRKRRARKR